MKIHEVAFSSPFPRDIMPGDVVLFPDGRFGKVVAGAGAGIHAPLCWQIVSQKRTKYETWSNAPMKGSRMDGNRDGDLNGLYLISPHYAYIESPPLPSAILRMVEQIHANRRAANAAKAAEEADVATRKAVEEEKARQLARLAHFETAPDREGRRFHHLPPDLRAMWHTEVKRKVAERMAEREFTHGVKVYCAPGDWLDD